MSLDALIHQAEQALRSALDAAAPEKVMAASLANLNTAPSQIFALGKAAGPMAKACRDAGLDAPGVLISHDQGLTEPDQHISGFETVIGGHPVPNDNSMIGATLMLERAARLNADDHLLMLVSGGGSALMCLPGEGLTLADKIMINERLLVSGLDIHAMNAVRRFCSGIKGGRLAQAAAPATITQWVLSDVPPTGDDLTDLSAIASGPMAADPVPEDQMLAYMTHAGLDEMPVIQTYLSQMAHQPERHPLRVWQDDGKAILAKVTTSILASNAICCDAAKASLGGGNFDLPPLAGEAAAMGQNLAAITATSEPGVKAVTGGETVVSFDLNQMGNEMGVKMGKGGRSQELALAYLLAMLEQQHTDAKTMPQDWVLLAAGTDGRDGPTDAAGALVHSGMALDLNRAKDALARHDSYPCLDDLGALIKMPPTGTNLADVAILLTA